MFAAREGTNVRRNNPTGASGSSPGTHPASPRHRYSARLQPRPGTDLLQRSAGSGPPAIQPECPGCSDKEEENNRIQAKLRLGRVDDPLEGEADRMAARVLRGDPPGPPSAVSAAARPACWTCEAGAEELRPAPAAGGARSAGFGTDAMAVARGGRPMSAAERAFFEPRFGRDFSGVRIHDGPRAHATASGIGARAFTLGPHIAFAAGQLAADRRAGRHLFTHELAHVVQQTADRPSAPPGIVRRTPETPSPLPARLPPAPAPAPPEFPSLWADFQRLHRSDPARAAALAAAMVPLMSVDDTRNHGIRLLFWLMDQGRWDIARQVLARLSDTYLLDWATRRLVQNPLFGVQSPDPALLVRRAESEARAGRYGPADALFRVAYELAQMILVDLTRRRRAEVERSASMISGSERRQVVMAQAATFGILSPTIQTYPDMSRIIGVIRDILGFYPREELAARRAGDANRARHLSHLGFHLRTDLLENHTLGREVVTMETVAAFNRLGGRGYSLLGVAGREEVVTPLPGTPTPRQLGLFPAFTSSLANLAESIAGQEELIAMLQGVPEVQRAFRNRPPDMNRTEDRIRVWRAMYSSYQRTSTLGLGVLYELMALIGRYLRAFTRHTEYNVRDYGVSYLSSDFPTDLAGRAVRDCGVYALTVAYEVYRTARAVRPVLPLEFRLYSVPEHVTLVIFDLDQDQHYLVNNDRISPARRGGPQDPRVLQSVANAYAATFGRAFAVTPMQDVRLGTTRQGDTSFRRQAWRRYLMTTLWGLEVEPPRGPTDTRTVAERTQATYRRYYDSLRNFDRGARALQQRLDRLSAAHGRIPAAGRRAQLGAALRDLFNMGVRLAIIFDTYGPHVRTVVSADPAQVRSVLGAGATPAAVARTLGRRAYLFAHQPGRESEAHPLSRLAGVLLRFQRLGGSLTQAQQSYVTWVRGVPPLNRYLQRYQGAGLPARF